MGWYFRRALRLGPLRVNLSKSGIGLSAGVKGARLGVNAKGQPYVAGGRGGFYFRQRLGQAQQQRQDGDEWGVNDPGARRRLPWIIAIGALLVLLAIVAKALRLL